MELNYFYSNITLQRILSILIFKYVRNIHFTP